MKEEYVPKMKVIQINVTYGSEDSTGRNVKELHEFLMKKDYQSFVFTTQNNEDNKVAENVFYFSGKYDQKVHAFCSRITGKQGYYSKKTTKQLVKKINLINPNIVLLHVLHSNCINFPQLFEYLSEKKIATILVLHDCWYYTGHCCHYTECKCEKWKEHCGKCPSIHEWNKSYFFDCSKKCISDKQKWYKQIGKLAVIGVSDWITNEAKSSILKNAIILRRIYNWIDLDIFKPVDSVKLRNRLEIKQGEKVALGVASNWNSRKGIEEIFQVAKEINNLRVIMIGDIPQNIKIPNNIIHIAKINNPIELAQYYSLADVFLNPSIQETFGKTTAESLGCGTPVVVYNTTACPELVSTGCGIVVDIMSKKKYVKAVEQVLNNQFLYTKEKCRMFAVENFDISTNLNQYEKLMRQLIEYK